MKNLLFGLLLLFPASVTIAQEKPVQTSQTEEIARLIDQLGADKYEDREAAHAALAKIGKPAISALMEARKSKDLEVASRADELIEKITGSRVEPDPKPKETPSKPVLPPESPGLPNLDPDDLKDMLDKVENFGGLSPELKKTLEGFQELFKESQSGTPDLSKMRELFEKFFDKKLPQLPDPNAPRGPGLQRIPGLDREITKSDLEKELGITFRPVSEAMKAHIRISPDRQDGSWDGLKQGLVVEKIDPKGRAFAQGLRLHDIVIFASPDAAPAVAMPGPWRAWNEWRSKATSIGTAESLNSLKDKKLYVEVIRQGTSCRIVELAPAPKSDKKAKGTKDF